ncbi:MAG: 30S ribosomal protein S5 [Planctomycetes bacterium]|nr:30S ribosomal protein S5 [Planctomycetota bacterium]MCH8211625.1 30S ribosomal protein S5 [Planctomycetota bacterium]MCH8259000.1 30S ribosomal protein S5 [Planctomycetota bacterium]
MAEILDESAALESTTVGVFRTAATVKGGRRFSFSSLVVVGDRQGRVGIGYGKANQVPPAIEKAQKEARRKMRSYPIFGRTLPHAVTGRFGACMVRLLPASPGTGVIAGASVRAPLEMVGVQDCRTKSYGSNNSKNLVKAVLNGLDQLRAKSTVESLRGVVIGTTEVEEAIERGKAFMPTSGSGKKAAAPVNIMDETRGRGKGRPRGGGRRGGGGGRGRRREVAADAAKRAAQSAGVAPVDAPGSGGDPSVSPPAAPAASSPEQPPASAT